MSTVAKNQGYRDLVAWQKARVLVKSVYIATRAWPADERFGLTHQVRRASVSIPSNIAEGKGKSSSNEYRHHLSIAHGSLCEVETQLLIGQDLDFGNSHEIDRILDQAAEVGRLIRGLIKSLE